MRVRKASVVAVAVLAMTWAAGAAAADFSGSWAGQTDRGKPVAMSVAQVGSEFDVVVPLERRGTVRDFHFSFVANGLPQQVEGPNPNQVYQVVASFQGEDLVMTSVLFQDGRQARAVHATWQLDGPDSLTITMGPSGDVQGAQRTFEFTRQ